MAEYGKDWIIENSVKILETYSGDQITVRQLYYRLVSIGYPNNIPAYKRVVDSTSKARWDNQIEFDAFIDRERTLYGRTAWEPKDLKSEIAHAKNQVKAWLSSYGLNRWSNQNQYVEVWIEKKALQGVFERPCLYKSVALAPCKGYPSLTFLNEAFERLSEVEGQGKEITIIYFGDYDPSGEDIPRSLKDNLSRMGIDIEVERIGLTPEQIAKYKLPGVPAKTTDSRTAAWSGSEAVELDAMDPKDLVKLCEDAIERHFDRDLYQDLKNTEMAQRLKYKAALVEWVANDMPDDQDDEAGA